MHDMDKLFDIFSKDPENQRRGLEILNQLQMDKHDFAFYYDQMEKRKI